MDQNDKDWAVNGEHGNDCEAFSDHDDAKRVMTNRIREELEDGSVPSWRESSIFVENSSMDFYEAYLDGEYMENHYKIMIIRQPLHVSPQFFQKTVALDHGNFAGYPALAAQTAVRQRVGYILRGNRALWCCSQRAP